MTAAGGSASSNVATDENRNPAAVVDSTYRRHNRHGRRVRRFYCRGATDTLALTRLPSIRAAARPSGSATWLINWLEQSTHSRVPIVVFGDSDDAGREGAFYDKRDWLDFAQRH